MDKKLDEVAKLSLFMLVLEVGIVLGFDPLFSQGRTSYDPLVSN